MAAAQPLMSSRLRFPCIRRTPRRIWLRREGGFPGSPCPTRPRRWHGSCSVAAAMEFKTAFIISGHFVHRSRERQLDDDLARFILAHGTEYRAAGATHITVLDDDLPPELRGTSLARRCRDWIVTVGERG